MAITAIEQMEMKVTLGVVAESPQKLLDQSEGKFAHRGHSFRSCVMQERSSTKVHHGASEGLVHGHVGMAIAADSSFIAKGLREGLSQSNAGIFHGVMKVYFDIAVRFEFKVHQTVAGEEGQHVVKERDLCANGTVSMAVNFELEADPRFGCVALDQGGALAHRSGVAGAQ